MENPFEAIRTEQFNDDFKVITTLFQKPWEYDKIIGRGNVVMEGGRGSGKTMILKYLSIQAQMAKLENAGKKPKEYNRNFIGIYLKLDPGPFDLFAQNVIEMDGWEVLFGHFFNLLAVTRILGATGFFLRKLEFETDESELWALVEKLARKLRFEEGTGDEIVTAKNPFDWIIDRLEAETGNVQVAANGYPIYGHLEYDRKITDLRTTIYDCCQLLLENLPPLHDRKIRFYLLLDEYDNLYEPQQKVVNTLIQKRDSPISFKVGTKNKGFYTKEDISNRILQVPDDYEHLSLDYENVADERYRRYVTEIGNKRLRLAGTSVAMDDFLPQLSIEEEVRSAIKATEENGANAVKEALLDVIAKDGKPESQYDYYKLAAVFRLLSSKRRPKRYSGFDTFVLLSSGIVRTFLRLCKECWSIAHFEEGFSSTGPASVRINPLVQHEGVTRVSDEVYNKIPDNVDITRDRLAVQAMCDAIGTAFRRVLLEAPLNEPEKLRIEIDRAEDLDVRIAGILDAAVRGSILQEVKPDKPKQVGAPIRTYALNRILAPHYGLSYRDRWSAQVPSHIFNSILQDPRSFTDYVVKGKEIAPGQRRIDEATVASGLLDPDHLPGNFENRVFVGGNYDFMANLREIVLAVEDNRFTPIFAYEYDIPRDQVHDYDIRLLHNCKRAIFEETNPAGELMELEKTRDFGTEVLIVYQIRSPDDKGYPSQISSMVKSVGCPTKGYCTFKELGEIIRTWLGSKDIEAGE